jgi:ABC-type amino acid transport substrate-binding protein
MKLFMPTSLLAASLASSGMPAQAADPLVLGYVARPGLADVVDGKPAGTYFPIAVAAAEKAGFAVTLQAVTQTRLMAQVASGQPHYCAVGIFITPERQAFGKFTLPIYRTPRFIVIAARSKDSAIRRHKTFMSLIADQQLRMGAIDGYSFGNTLDPLIRAMHGNVDRYVGTFDQGFAKMQAGRFDYIIGFEDEFDNWLGRSGASRDAFSKINFPDVLDGVHRHLMCSRNVDDATIERLNAGIQAVAPHP